MKILDKIVKDKTEEILKLSISNPISSLENEKLFSRKCISLKESISRSASGIICEFKRRSPSNNNINNKSTISEVVRGYQKAGAAGLSILTNKKYFDSIENGTCDFHFDIAAKKLKIIFVLKKHLICAGSMIYF